MFVAKVVNITGLCFVDVCKKIKIKSFVRELVFMDFDFPVRVQSGEYFVIFSQNLVDIPHVRTGFTIHAIVVIIATLIGTEFFIRTAGYRFVTVKTFPLHNNLF